MAAEVPIDRAGEAMTLIEAAEFDHDDVAVASAQAMKSVSAVRRQQPWLRAGHSIGEVAHNCSLADP